VGRTLLSDKSWQRKGWPRAGLFVCGEAAGGMPDSRRERRRYGQTSRLITRTRMFPPLISRTPTLTGS
jgi:hypothetical protein